MPRKVTPRWADYGEHSEPQLCLCGLELQTLAGMIGVLPGTPDWQEFNAHFDHLLSCFRERHGRLAEAVSRAEAVKTLEEFRKAGRLNFWWAQCLNPRALQALHWGLVRSRAPLRDKNDTIVRAWSEDRLSDEAIRAGIDCAIEFLRDQKGPDPMREIHIAVSRLCHLYKRFTGQPVTHSNKGEHLAYEQAPQSEAGRFVSAAFQIIDDKVRPSQLSNALRWFVECRPQAF